MINRSTIGKLIAYITLLVFFIPWSVQIVHIFTTHHHTLHCNAHKEQHWHDKPDKCEICAFSFTQFVDHDKIKTALVGEHSIDKSEQSISNIHIRFKELGFDLRAPPEA
ncbi:MAG: hypothetical protein K9I94_06925 [Bacteroidales bacterium]|nr:hypothetical protein [Bacteroidales bacterium]